MEAGCWIYDFLSTRRPNLNDSIKSVVLILGDKTNEHQLPKETVQETTANTKHHAEDSLDSTVTSVNWHSITWKLLSKNAIQPEENTVNKILDGYKIKEPRPGVLKSKFTSPASPPLYFYFGYQLLQESGLLQKLGHVSKNIL